MAYVFPKLRTTKDAVRKMSKKPSFRIPFDNQHDKGSQRLLKSAHQHFLSYFLITMGKIKFQNVCLSDI